MNPADAHLCSRCMRLEALAQGPAVFCYLLQKKDLRRRLSPAGPLRAAKIFDNKNLPTELDPLRKTGIELDEPFSPPAFQPSWAIDLDSNRYGAYTWSDAG